MLIQDLRYAFRSLSKAPGFVAVTVLTLALAIGANVSIFSVVNAVLLRPLPYPEPDRLIMVWDTNAEQSRDHERPSPGNFLDWMARGEPFDGLAAWHKTSRTLRGNHDAEQVETAQVAGDLFGTLRVAAALGQVFSPEADAGAAYNVANQYVGGSRVAVISDKLWRRLGADPDLVGGMISLDGTGWQVLGVMPAGFAFPDADTDAWVPWDLARSYDARRFPEGPPRDFRFLNVIARLKAGFTLSQAQSNMDSIASELGERHPKANLGWGVRLVPLGEEIVGGAKRALLVLFGAVGFVLLIACANVASLQLARATGRQREIAVRAALGASRLRLIRQLLTESLLLALAGGVAGLALAYWGLGLLIGLAPAGLPRINEVTIDGSVLAFTLAAASLSAIIFGLAPALQGSKTELAVALKEGGSFTTTAGAGRQRFRRVLVVSEVAIALVLMIGAGLFVRSFARVLAVDPGFNPANLFVLRVFLDNNSYRTGAQSSAYYGSLLERLRGLPAVEAAAAATALPMSDVGVDFDRPYWREGEADPGGQAAKADIRMTTPDYFDVMNIPIIKGRAFTDLDGRDSQRVIMVNETLARLVWPGEDAVGKRLVIDYRGGAYPYEVVGLAGDTRYYGLKSRPRPEVFIPHAQNPYLIMNVVLRTSIDPEQVMEAAKREVLAHDPAQPVHSAVTMDRLVAASVAADRFSMSLLGVLAVVALVLAAGGIYGVMAYFVSQRTHEIGLRAALGAQPADVLKLILGESAKLVLAGVFIGLAASLALSRVVSSLLYNTSATDPATFVWVAAALAASTLAASYIPARRAMKVDPVIALRCE